MNGSYQTSIVAAIVALTFIGSATIIGLAITDHLDAQSTPLIVTLLSSIGVVITALLAVIRTDRTLVEAKRLNDGTKRRLEEIEKLHTPPSTEV